MPSFSHEILVELFRNRPQLACELLAACAGIEARGDRVELGSIDLSQAVPVEYRADAVVLLRDPEDVITSALVVEIQLQMDPGKRLSWPQYVTALRARLECPVLLLVIVTASAVASWARTPIETGHPGFSLVPIVIELAAVPRVTDADEARRRPELAVLSVIAHPEVEVARAAVDGISTVQRERADLYLDLILRALPQSLGDLIGVDVLKNYEYQSEFMRKLSADAREQGLRDGKSEGMREGLREGRSEGMREGMREGRSEGMREGRSEGMREGMRDAALRVARARVTSLSSDLEARIIELENIEALQQLFDALLHAGSERDAITAIERLA